MSGTAIYAARDKMLWEVGRSYVAGVDREAALTRTHELAAQGIAANIGTFAEVASDEATAAATTREYVSLAKGLARAAADTQLDLDLPHVGLEVGASFCIDQLAAVCDALPDGKYFQIGADVSSWTDAHLEVVFAAHREGLPIHASLQANLRRSLDDAVRLTEAGIPVRLVKGGYPEPPDIAWPWGPPTDQAYRQLARLILDAGTGLTLATHDHVLQDEFADVEVEMLLGVLPELAGDLAHRGRRIRLFVPYGQDWQRYVNKRVADAQAAQRAHPARLSSLPCRLIAAGCQANSHLGLTGSTRPPRFRRHDRAPIVAVARRDDCRRRST
jgi:proline dehydrogenase